MAASSFKSGYNAGLQINSNPMPIARWTVSASSELALFKNSMTGPIAVPEGTYKEYTFTFELDFDFGNDPFASPFNIAPGAQLTNAAFYLSQSARGAYDGKVLTATKIFIQTCPIMADTVANRSVSSTVTGRLYETVTLPS